MSQKHKKEFLKTFFYICLEESDRLLSQGFPVYYTLPSHDVVVYDTLLTPESRLGSVSDTGDFRKNVLSQLGGVRYTAKSPFRSV